MIKSDMRAPASDRCPAWRLGRSSPLVRFLRGERAATAVEFALLAAPFLALLVAILQLAVVLFAQQALQTATYQASRLIMTGQAQAGGMTPANFQAQICSRVSALFNCSGISVNVQTFTNFSSATMGTPVSNGKLNVGQFQFSPGGPGQIVVVQAFYEWPLVLGPLGFNLSNLNNNSLLLVSTAAFRNEPF